MWLVGRMKYKIVKAKSYFLCENWHEASFDIKEQAQIKKWKIQFLKLFIFILEKASFWFLK